jgi:hypothetical protein
MKAFTAMAEEWERLHRTSTRVEIPFSVPAPSDERAWLAKGIGCWFLERVSVCERSYAAVWRLHEDFTGWCGVRRDCDVETFTSLLHDEAGVPIEVVEGRTWARGIMLVDLRWMQ